MRKFAGMLTGVAAAFIMAGSAQAQDLSKTAKVYSFEIRPAVGVVVPLTDDLDTGWDLGASLRASPPSWPIALQLDLCLVDVGSSEFQITANAVYPFQTASESFRPYLIGGLGLLDGNFELNAGVGADFAISGSPIGFFGEARFHRVFTDGDDVSILPINAGVRLRF